MRDQTAVATRHYEHFIGSPQGGIISPILANASLHELDEFVEGLRKQKENGETKTKAFKQLLQFSLAKTLACKSQLSARKVFKRFGKTFTIVIQGKERKKDRKITFYLNHDWDKRRDAFQNGKQSDIDLVRTAIQLRARPKLGKPCCICEEATGQIVLHHVRHVRKLSHKREATGFNRILRAINRKQIPVCIACHGKIHRGEYDHLKLSELAYIPR